MIFKLFRLALKKNRLGKRPTKVRQKVVLLADYQADACEIVPKEGTSYECGGTILSMEKCRGVATVKWCNGYTSSYNIPFLKVISNKQYNAFIHIGFAADNPNVTFKQKKTEGETEIVFLDDGPSYYTVGGGN